jgi:hypothetical protein
LCGVQGYYGTTTVVDQNYSLYETAEKGVQYTSCWGLIEAISAISIQRAIEDGNRID